MYFPYPISDVFTTITDDSGRVVYKHIHRNLSFSQKNMQPAQFLPLEELENVRGSRIQMVCQLYNGEKLVAMDAPWIE